MGKLEESIQRQDIYKQLFLNASEGMLLTNSKGDIVEINPKITNMFGYESDELIGQKVEMLVPREKRNHHVGLRQAYHEHPVHRSMGMGMNLYGEHKNGEQIPIEISLNYFGEGNDLIVMALITDISARVKIEQEIQKLNEELEQRVNERTEEVLQSQNLYVSIARNFPDGTISVFDQELNYVFFEGKDLYQAGISSRKIIGTSIKDRLPEDVREKVISLLNSVLEGESGTIEFATKGQHFELHAVPLKNVQGKIHQILVVERNITKQKMAEDEMLAMLHKERTLNELKSRFVSMASHEFRTPLSTILSSISLIDKYQEGQAKEKVDKHVGRIKSSVQNLTGILNDFLSLDKLEAGKIRTNPAELDLKHLIQDVIEELEAILKKKQTIVVDYKGDDEKVFIDAQIIKNILINLMSNAIKYSPEDKSINLHVKLNSREIEIVVKDEGIGIPVEEQSHMFERFFRAKNVTNIEGTGLGLNIVYKYVELLGGEIDFTSEESKGTTFVVRIPLNEYHG